VKFFLDTANINEIKRIQEFGLVDGVTTNPTLLAKEGGRWEEIVESICKLVDGPVHLEVVSTNARDIVREAKDLIKFGPNVVAKISMSMEAIEAVRILSSMGIPTNVSLIFSPLQALMAAKAGANYVSPFVGRLDDLGHDGMELVSQIISIFENYGFDTEVIVSSIRHPGHVLDAALMGADIATIPFKVIQKLSHYPEYFYSS
jgi:transaldolase